MRKAKARRQAGCRQEQGSGGDYDVGYGKPPKKHQFKPGQSGNPKGRPKAAKNEATIWRELMQERIDVELGGRKRRITSLQAVLLRCRNAALGGDLRSMKFVLDRLRLLDETEPDGEKQLNPGDREVLDSLIEDLEEKIKGKEE